MLMQHLVQKIFKVLVGTVTQVCPMSSLNLEKMRSESFKSCPKKQAIGGKLDCEL